MDVGIGGKGTGDVTGHADDGFIGVHGAARPLDQTNSSAFDRTGSHLMKTIDDLIAVVALGAPAGHKALFVYPLAWGGRCESAAYLVLDDALGTGQFRITEVSESGSVPRLLAINESSTPILLLDGEELVGAKQNRVLNLSIMLAPKSKTEIPVSCVEAGRWRAESHAFQTAQRVQFARGRAQKMEQVSHSLCLNGEAASDQTAVWGAISAKSARMRVASPTEAMAALFDSRRDELRDYLDAIPTSDGQCGAVYAIGDVVVGMEIFASDTTFKKLAGKLVASYALDAMELNRPAKPPDARVVRAFIDSVCAATRQRSSIVGIGETVRLSANDLVGAALEVAGGCVHLAAFRRQAFEGQSRDGGVRGARMLSSSARARRW
jgi:hypothetical protein